MVSFVNYWYNKKNMLGELIFVVACFKKALRDFRDHPGYPGPKSCRSLWLLVCDWNFWHCYSFMMKHQKGLSKIHPRYHHILIAMSWLQSDFDDRVAYAPWWLGYFNFDAKKTVSTDNLPWLRQKQFTKNNLSFNQKPNSCLSGFTELRTGFLSFILHSMAFVIHKCPGRCLP